MVGLRFLLNNRELAVVSNENRNILTAYVSGDVIDKELASASMTGGNYSDGSESAHKIWVDDIELVEGDEIEIQFLADVQSCSSAMTLKEHALAHEDDVNDVDLGEDDMYAWFAKQPRIKERFVFDLMVGSADWVKLYTNETEFSFHFGVMWKWTNPNEVTVSLTSSTLEGMENRSGGRALVKDKISSGQCIKFRVGTSFTNRQAASQT